MERTGAAAVIIGNEILTGKEVDSNGPHLARRLRDRGIALRSMVVVPDEVDPIVEAVCAARRRAGHVVTSGGIGPTHDDVTVRAVALALGRKVVRREDLVRLIQLHHGEDVPLAALRMADIPEGSELWPQEGVWFPVLTCDGVSMLPGVPQLFRYELETVLSRLQGTRMHLRCLYLSAAEAQIAQALDSVALELPEVAIGSYPTFDRAADHAVKVTVEHADPSQVDDALARLRCVLPHGSVVRVE